MPRLRPDKTAFTLVEILIVVIILGILAMIVVPQFSNASHTARESTLRDDLRFLRMQFGAYKIQHRDVSPGYAAVTRDNPSEASLVAQMTRFTDEDGNDSASASATIRFGPYLSRMPVNPLAEQAGVLIVADGQPMPDSGTFPIMNGAVPYGWIYKPQTQEIIANSAGSDINGTAYSSY